ncbi:MAG: family 10 glycosylhydrolase, partial [Planctomycetota bacterium]
VAASGLTVPLAPMMVALRTSTLIGGLLAVVGCRAISPASEPPLPDPLREFRAAWVATVSNIDWPSRPGLSANEQQAEAVGMLDRLVALNMNAVVFQVRPHCDALYESELEPWSAYLSGEEGVPPAPYYDPLAFWIEEAHVRGLELHAWFNPYRAAHPSRPGEPAESSILNQRPELSVVLGKGAYRWLDPALPEVQAHSLAVVLDVVERYDIDGVHFDDYFYPYPSYHDGEDFPDHLSWDAYVKGGGSLSRGDWRRAAVDSFVETVYGEIKKRKPWVELGISPFGIWRPGHPRGIQGFDQYAALYADARKWLVEGWLDYFTPQLYWPIAQSAQSFSLLLAWWGEQNHSRRHLWPGLAIHRMRGKAGAIELAGEILTERAMESESPGVCLFSMRHLMKEDSTLPVRLSEDVFSRRALIPPSPWLGIQAPACPVVSRGGEGVTFQAGKASDIVRQWLIQWEADDHWYAKILPGGSTSCGWTGAPAFVAVRAVGRSRALSPAAILTLHDS